MPLPDADTIQLLLDLGGFKTIDEAIAAMRDLQATTGALTREQEQALTALELYKDILGQVNPAMDAVTQAAVKETQAQRIMNQILEESQDVMTKTKDKAEKLAGSGDGEDGKGGFKGAAGAAVKAEKAIGMLASGGGLGRLPGMLEGVAGALGLASGAGLAAGGLILAFESIIPKIVTFIEKIDGAAESAKHAAEMMKAAYDQMQKLKEQPDEEEQTSAKVVKEALSGKKGMQIATGIEQSLEAEGYSLNESQVKLLANPNVSQYEKDIILEGQRSAIITRRGRIMKELEAGHQATISDVEGMAIRHEGFFPFGTEQHLRQALPENIEAAKKQSQQAEAVSDWAETTYAKQEAARKENVGIQDEFDKALKDKRKHDVKAKATGFKDQIGDLKTELSDLGMNLREKTISPEEYKEKADTLVDAIAAAVQAMAKLPGEDVKAARRDIDAAQRTVRSMFDQGVKAVKHAADKAAADAKTKADKYDREHTPEAINRREVADTGNRVMAEEQYQNQYRADQGAVPFEASELEQIKHKVMQAMPEARRRGINVGQLVSWMMAMQANEIEQGLTEGLGHHTRSAQLTNPSGGH